MIENAHMDDPKLETSNDYNLPGRLFAVFVVTLCSFGLGLFLTWVSSLNPIWGGSMTDWPSIIFTGLVTLTGACCGVKQILLKPVLMETGVDWKFLVAGAAHEGTYFLESGDILCGTLSFNGTRTTYAYDSANQLTTVTTGAGSTTYGYDLVGNRTTSTMTLMNEVTDDGTFTHVYDNEGNETSKTNKATHDVWSFGYDNLNHMTTAIDKNSRGRR